jgi:hypothetical protein
VTASSHLRSIAVLASVLLSGPSSATLIPSEEVKLSTRERVFLQHHICGDGQKVEQIRAERIETEPVSILAHIVCFPHATLAGYPALKTGECEKTYGTWKCDRVLPALRMNLRSEELVLEYSDSVSPDAAVEVIKFANSASTFNGRDVSGLLVGRCRVSDGRTIPFPGAVTFSIQCQGPAAKITKDCWDRRCRMFFTDFGVWVP